MTSPQAENFASQSSDPDVEPINNILDILIGSDSLEDDLSQDESELASVIEKPDTSKEIAEFEKLVESKKTENQAKSSDELDAVENSELSDIEVEVEAQTNLTLEKAVEHEAFLRQTINPEESKNSSLSSSQNDPLSQFEQALAIETKSASTEELVDAVNTLIPLIVELLKYKIEDSQESILQGITPVLEKIIEQRTQEEPQKMAIAIAKILPSAITENINLSPEQIAKAIAPELALSIKEQILLDEDAISEALGSEMGKAIKTQIEVEKDAMVDALYPVIGDTISKYMVEVVKEINNKVENTLSPEGFQRKLQAKLKGVSEAELILQESIGCHVQAIFLIDKDSGVVIQEIQNSEQRALDADMVAGMLTAIRSFANDCIVSGSELDSIDYGNWQIHLEVAGYCYLAVVLKGEPNQKFLTRIRRVFGDIILHQGDALEKFEGNIDVIPNSVNAKLTQLIESEDNSEEKASSPKVLLWLLVFILAIVLIPWGISSYHSKTANKIEQVTAIELDAAPELSVYRLEPTVEKGILTLKGRVPSEYLRNQATTITQAIARENNLEFDNQITTVNVPAKPSLLTGEILRLTELFNQQPGVSLKTNYQSPRLSIEGFILDQNLAESMYQAFSKIPGIEQTIIKVANKLPKLETRIYFDSAATKIDFASNSSKIGSVAEFLNKYSDLNLRLLAYSDGIGSKQNNLKLGMQRCSNVKKALLAERIDSSRLAINCDIHRVSVRQPNQTIKLTRYIEFEPFLPTRKSPHNH